MYASGLHLAYSPTAWFPFGFIRFYMNTGYERHLFGFIWTGIVSPHPSQHGLPVPPTLLTWFSITLGFHSLTTFLIFKQFVWSKAFPTEIDSPFVYRRFVCCCCCLTCVADGDRPCAIIRASDEFVFQNDFKYIDDKICRQFF